MVVPSEQTYSKLSDNPEIALNIDPAQETAKCRQRMMGMFALAMAVSMVGFLVLGFPIIAGVCTIHTKTICNVTVAFDGLSDVSYNGLSTHTRKTFATNQTVCYLSDNTLAGKAISFNVFDDIVMDKCFVWYLLSTVFGGSILLVVGCCAIIWGLSEMATLRCCQRLGSSVMPL